MYDSKIYAKFAAIISGNLDRVKAAIGYIGHHGQEIQESIFRITKVKQKFIK